MYSFPSGTKQNKTKQNIWRDAVWYWLENPSNSGIRSGILKGCSVFAKKQRHADLTGYGDLGDFMTLLQSLYSKSR